MPQFAKLSDDDINLWDAVAIVGERKKHFRVKWAGMDPVTGEPWEDSWVPKHNVTPDLVETWRAGHTIRTPTGSDMAFVSIFTLT
ncbi:hypothetical protein F5051DRAFT_341253 [Lentinula edodes]|nr:hypothetical protein F5051DRAFT_341253 [Lentinula edodes]